MKRFLCALILIICIAGICGCNQKTSAKAVKANLAVQDDYSWIRGANYVPSYARNDVQIWMDYDSNTIDRELGFAAGLRLNSVRFFLQYAVYKNDPKRFMRNYENFLSLCDKHGIKAMIVLFDSCFGEFPDLKHYKDKDWMANPGQNMLGEEFWPQLEKYLENVCGKFRGDKRIVMWDVMNEPMCTSFASTEEGREKIWKFLSHFLDVVKKIDPTHPRTVGYMTSANISRLVDKTDVIAFHNYIGDMNAFRKDVRFVKSLGEKHNKPVIINEVARRETGQDFWLFMPVLQQENIGWYFWELMLGKTEFSRGDNPIQGVIYTDGTCKDPREIAAILNFYPASKPSEQRLPGQIDDTQQSGFLTYSDGWTLWKGSGPRGNTLHYANQEGCEADLNFSGTKVFLVHKTGPDCGIAEIFVDGKESQLQPQIDTYSADVDWNHKTLVADGLSPGVHKITIRVTGRKNPASSNTYVQIVGFDIDTP